MYHLAYPLFVVVVEGGRVVDPPRGPSRSLPQGSGPRTSQSPTSSVPGTLSVGKLKGDLAVPPRAAFLPGPPPESLVFLLCIHIVNFVHHQANSPLRATQPLAFTCLSTTPEYSSILVPFLHCTAVVFAHTLFTNPIHPDLPDPLPFVFVIRQE